MAGSTLQLRNVDRSCATGQAPLFDSKHAVGPHAGLASVGPVTMVGDNPASDIAGANAAGPHWRSCLVRTGVFSGGANCTIHPADAVVADVHDAVVAALHHHRAARWHAAR